MRSAQVDLCRQNDELERGRTDVLRREEQVALRETDANITSLALDAREEQIARRVADADLASSALATWEEQVANQEVDLPAREQAVKARAEQLEQSQAEVAAQHQEILTMRGIPISAADDSSLEARLKNAKDELDDVLSERRNVKLMMRDILRQARDTVEVAELGRVFVRCQSLETETIGHIALGFAEIARRLEALPAAVQELATREGRALAQSVAEHYNVTKNVMSIRVVRDGLHVHPQLRISDTLLVLVSPAY
ncbi:uncharacterized protein LOC133928081 [Phragmites australis]|uniref:uncharacterized protein LOC133928081 n=1 Tax=Phragmites australis TaxID=29695 RepID=UPI002D77BE16|nr:uncharacterized protein LOC133928081 [Phragmites australis]